MDLRSILNVDDRPKSNRKSSGSSRTESHKHHNSSSKHSSRHAANAIKVETAWSGHHSPICSPTESVYSAAYSWTQSLSPADNNIVYLSGDGNVSSRDHPRITSSLSSPATNKRRPSAYSSFSRSSSSSSSPSPPTPSSTMSGGHPYGSILSGTDQQYKRYPNSDRVGLTETNHHYHYMVQTQPAYTVTQMSNIPHSSQINRTPIHFERVLPLPMARPATMPSSPGYSYASQEGSYDHSMAGPTAYPDPSEALVTPSFQASLSYRPAPRQCAADSNCDLKSPKRRIVSQFFGRNKKETRLIPRQCWVFYCRQHYQRDRYRYSKLRFAELQMSLVRSTVVALERENNVISWDIKIRKRALDQIMETGRTNRLDKSSSGSKKSGSTAEAGPRERHLLPFCGSGKSFEHVYQVLDVVLEICRQDNGSALEFELLPNFTEEYIRMDEERRRISGKDVSDSEAEDDDPIESRARRA